jgi:hypothetical protein
MKRFLAGRRFLGVAALLALVALPAILLGPRLARAFTLVPTIVYFDAVSVPVDHTLHVHLVNQFGTGPMIFRASLKPTTPGAGSPVLGAAITLNPGEGSDQSFTFAGFSPPAGATYVPVVASILVSAAGGGALPADWSGRVASSVEILDDQTGRQTAILGSRHIVVLGPGGAPTFCVFCNCAGP